MSRPLEGIKVVDCGQFIQAPAAAAMLGDLGAEVIKVEQPVVGDPVRGLTKVMGVQSAGKGWSTNVTVEVYNWNKRSITLNLRKEKGKKILYQMIEKSDVFLHNWEPDVAGKLGVDYETLSQYNPRLIYAASSAWGTKGPDVADPALDFAAIARSGLGYVAGEPDYSPLIFKAGIADQSGAMVLTQAILAALFARERQGIGQKIEVSMIAGATVLQTHPFSCFLFLGEELPRRSRTDNHNPLWNYYCCGDGKWIALAMLQSDRYWPDFCKVMGIEELRNDPRFVDMDARDENRFELIAILDKRFATKPRTEWLKLLKGDFICQPVQTYTELVNDPQLIENEYVIDFEHPTLGKLKTIGFPYKFSETPLSTRTAAPVMGQHTEEILLELGYSWDDIVSLKDEEVI